MHLSLNRRSNADNTLANLPTLIDLSAEQLAYYTDYVAFRSLLKTWQNTGKNLYALDSTDIAQLHYYAAKTTGIQNKVLPLLAINGASNYLPPIYNPYNVPTGGYQNKWSGSQEQTTKLEAASQPNHVLAYPNPTKESLTLSYRFREDLDAVLLSVYDMQGSLVSSQPLTTASGEVVLDVSAYRNGSY